ncbi:putative mitochondrial Nadh-cytochrome b5 reductase-like protein [Leptomonas pyrrhocoris]|uniref:Putative mitochondrial Nadh-cytochrome b5 reductase-like protein n=1 Tax=Leptomonas pyrrhocoris TaxID=157538 RepID=A0A0M9FVP9_LEPPY|nr:putative mitochondrial Nadh-cytochrome b5 reductase-like protein [Leptomonas pyrrhocoris]KPA76929.1 putative mitochondrial Nadh-cytochrome b5 reductase-like protein [Leptomonas pyrrhocoris]|eukprot:XP_015655368.1 putative mitochondrial Nadh-cytochrome b5 reductase-like protein [Leptomonas pyrrhocoris]
MPPKPWEEQLPGATTARRRPPAHSDTFGDYEYHQQKRYGQPGERDPFSGPSGQQRQNKGNTGSSAFASTSTHRWSFALQDIPGDVRRVLNDVNMGYAARVAALVGLTGGVSYALYHWVLAPAQQRRPLAQRWSWCAPPVPITLVEKNREEGSSMFVYRFALPNSYDYAGYEPVSSVRMMSGHVRELSSLSRWYTPISHPDERGYIEFAIKDCDPGRMSARLRYLEPGDVVYLGRWMREFSYKPNTLKELGVVCTTAGASVALQLMNVIDKHKSDATQLRVLYCHHTITDIPFRDSLFKRYEEHNKDRIRVAYNVLAGGRRKGTAAPVEENVYVGNIDPETIAAALPPPIRVVQQESHLDGSRSTPPDTHPTTYRPQLLVCGPQSMLMHLCGRVSSVGNYFYWQGPFYRYSGFLKDMGYTRSQVYKFGVSTHFLADH